MQQDIIAFDAKRIVRNGTGLGSYGRTLVNDLAALGRYRLLLYAPDAGRDELRCQVPESQTVSYRYPSGLGQWLKSWWRTWGVVADARRDGARLFHGLSGELPVGIASSGMRSVVTIHDVIFLRHPEFYHWADRKIYAWKFRQTVRQADHIIAISECTKRDIMEYGHVGEDKISVIYQSYAPRFSATVDEQTLSAVSSRYSLPGRYVLSVGSIEARKNILLAVKALQYLPQDISLVVVGRHTAYTDTVVSYAASHGLSSRLCILHGVPDADLPAIYGGAESFVYPSVYEGFGIPIIEAISCGLPVVACTGSCLEEAGGPDALYVGTDDAVGMASAISQTLRGASGREERIAASRRYIERFCGSSVAEQVAKVYRRLLDGKC